MALGVLSLLAGLVGGLVRLGWPLPAAPPLAGLHGPLMVAGFLGTVIGLERAVAVGRGWAYAGPVASGVGALALVAGAPAGAWLMALGSVALALASVEIVRRQRALFTVVMALGAGAWAVGQILWLAGTPLSGVVAWWMGFLVLTIAGERLELTRLVRMPAAGRAAFIAVVGALLGGLLLSLVAPDAGARLIGLALVALAAWLGRFDIARRTVAMAGLTRFIAVALLSGYVWLAVGGGLFARWGSVGAGPHYDAMLHAVFVGFAFSMIFGHAPIIVPAVIGITVAYRPAFYVPLVLLHVSLALRLAGDLASWWPGRGWGGLLNAVAVLTFFATTAYAAVRARRAQPA